MQRVIYSCPFIPMEWIAAHGLLPSRVLPGAGAPTAAAAAEGVCPYAWAFAGAAAAEPDAAAVIVTTACDQMRRVSERILRADGAPVFLFHVPATWQTPTAHRLYEEELRRLGRFLERVGGQAPTPETLMRAVADGDDARALLRDARGLLPPRRFSEAVAQFHRDGRFASDSAPAHVPHGVPLALLGGPMRPAHFGLFDLIERAGGTVALDGTESGERTLPPPFDRRLMKDDPFAALVDAYFRIPDAFRRPNSLLYAWLKETIAARGIRGVVLRHYTWCDTWHAEAQRMKEWLPVPLLALTAGADDTVDAHTRSRIEAFLEMAR